MAWGGGGTNHPITGPWCVKRMGGDDDTPENGPSNEHLELLVCSSIDLLPSWTIWQKVPAKKHVLRGLFFARRPCNDIASWSLFQLSLRPLTGEWTNMASLRILMRTCGQDDHGFPIDLHALVMAHRFATRCLLKEASVGQRGGCGLPWWPITRYGKNVNEQYQQLTDHLWQCFFGRQQLLPLQPLCCPHKTSLAFCLLNKVQRRSQSNSMRPFPWCWEFQAQLP